MTADPRRAVPRTDAVLADPGLAIAHRRLGRLRVKAAVVATLAEVRAGRLAPDDVVARVLGALPSGATTMRAVINATGVVLHTNLGRAQLSDAAREALEVAAGTVDVEFDLLSGRRSTRGRATIAAMLRAVPEAEAALVVNNGAAALVLATTALATTPLAAGPAGEHREVIVSRGEMVEIGDGFRLPDLIASTGARLREVGTTNRTRLADYAAAVGPMTAAILKVHPSNFRIEGFTASVDVSQLSTLGVPVIADVGSGLLRPHPSLPDEPDVSTALHDGAAVVTCSADKLLGGPQAGLLFGTSEVVELLRTHPLARALRIDKLSLAALEATLDGPPTPTESALTADAGELRERCTAIAAALCDIVTADVVASDGVVGGGGAPGVTLPGWAVAVPAQLAVALRTGVPAVVARTERDRCLLDLRCVPGAEDARLVEAVAAAVRRRAD